MRIAVVGCGQIADAHIEESRKIPGVLVAAVCDRNAHMAQQAALRFGIPRAYHDLEEMLEQVQPDVVHITTPPQSHLPVAEVALRGGAHVYVEKPFTVDGAESEELVAAAIRCGRLVCVGHNRAFDSAFLRMRDSHNKGLLGDVVHVEAMFGYNLAGPFAAASMGDPMHWIHRLPGGLAQNSISHPLAAMLEFIRDEKPQIHAQGFKWRAKAYGDIRDEFCDELRVMIGGRRVTGHLVFSCHLRPLQFCVAVSGTRAQAIANLEAGTFRLLGGSLLPGPFGRIGWARDEAIQARREYFGNISRFLRARLQRFEGMKELFHRFYQAIEGKGEMPISMSEAHRTTVIMDEIFRQCSQGTSSVVEAESTV